MIHYLIEAFGAKHLRILCYFQYVRVTFPQETLSVSPCPKSLPACVSQYLQSTSLSYITCIAASALFGRQEQFFSAE